MDKTPQRNDPCPCGSKKKYKKCCGFNLELKKQLKAKIIAKGPIAAAFGSSTDSFANDFFKRVKVTSVHAKETKTALDKMKENNSPANKEVEKKEEV